jgi:hypothetical protein
MAPEVIYGGCKYNAKVRFCALCSAWGLHLRLIQGMPIGQFSCELRKECLPHIWCNVAPALPPTSHAPNQTAL